MTDRKIIIGVKFLETPDVTTKFDEMAKHFMINPRPDFFVKDSTIVVTTKTSNLMFPQADTGPTDLMILAVREISRYLAVDTVIILSDNCVIGYSDRTKCPYDMCTAVGLLPYARELQDNNEGLTFLALD